MGELSNIERLNFVRQFADGYVSSVYPMTLSPEPALRTDTTIIECEWGFLRSILAELTALTARAAAADGLAKSLEAVCGVVEEAARRTTHAHNLVCLEMCMEDGSAALAAYRATTEKEAGT